jgi:hypothetical protein
MRPARSTRGVVCRRPAAPARTRMTGVLLPRSRVRWQSSVPRHSRPTLAKASPRAACCSIATSSALCESQATRHRLRHGCRRTCPKRPRPPRRHAAEPMALCHRTALSHRLPNPWPTWPTGLPQECASCVPSSLRRWPLRRPALPATTRSCTASFEPRPAQRVHVLSTKGQVQRTRSVCVSGSRTPNTRAESATHGRVRRERAFSMATAPVLQPEVGVGRVRTRAHAWSVFVFATSPPVSHTCDTGCVASTSPLCAL